MIGFLVAADLLEKSDASRAMRTIICMLATAGPMILADVFLRGVHRRRSAGFALERRARPLDLRRVGTKLLGFWTTLGVIALVYWVAPEYRRDFYEPFWEIIRLALPVLLVGSIPYFALVDRRQEDPEDEYWQAGCVMTGRWASLDGRTMRHYALGWVIKGFYLPLMTTLLSRAINSFSAVELSSAMESFPLLVTYVAKLSLAIDLAFVAIGYSLTLRVIDSHIRSPNPFAYGWVVTLVLYTPFWGLIGNRYFGYGDNEDWTHWMGNVPVLLYVWGTLIILSKLGWAWSNVSFGTRFSNLTHRGIITNGPYRFTKHPSYLFKNVSWWLLSVPFLSVESPLLALQHSVALLGVNALYFFRARAEEQHLSEDPVYVEYAQWIEEHGVLRFLGRLVPVLRYRAPAGDATASD